MSWKATVRPPGSLLEAEQAKLPQPFFIGWVFQPSLVLRQTEWEAKCVQYRFFIVASVTRASILSIKIFLLYFFLICCCCCHVLILYEQGLFSLLLCLFLSLLTSWSCVPKLHKLLLCQFRAFTRPEGIVSSSCLMFGAVSKDLLSRNLFLCHVLSFLDWHHF